MASTYRDPLISVRLTVFGLLFFLLTAITTVLSSPQLLIRWEEYRRQDSARTQASYRNLGMLTKAIFYKGFEKDLPPEERALMPHLIVGPAEHPDS